MFMSLKYECLFIFVVALVVQQHLSAEGTDVRTACSSSEFYTIRTIWHHTVTVSPDSRLHTPTTVITGELHSLHEARGTTRGESRPTTNSRELKPYGPTTVHPEYDRT